MELSLTEVCGECQKLTLGRFSFGRLLDTFAWSCDVRNLLILSC